MSDFVQDVVDAFEGGLCCSESVVMAMATHLHCEPSVPLAMAAGLCGGQGDRQGDCGALTGAVVAIGLMSDAQRPQSARVLAAELGRKFRARHGVAQCQQVLKGKRLLEGKRSYCLGITRQVAEDLVTLIPALGGEGP